jgi:hypothetical protein
MTAAAALSLFFLLYSLLYLIFIFVDFGYGFIDLKVVGVNFDD